MTYQCLACQRDPAHGTAERRCAFHTGVFTPDGWCCATIEALRDLVFEGQSPMPPGVDYRYCSDQKYATVHIDDVTLNDEPIGLALWVSWYKSRGSTDAVWVLSSEGPPRAPTEMELRAILQDNGIRLAE